MNPPAIVAFSSWLSSPLGQYLAEQERAWLARTVDGIFGFVAVQMDVPELDALAHNRMLNRWFIGWNGDPHYPSMSYFLKLRKAMNSPFIRT